VLQQTLRFTFEKSKGRCALLSAARRWHGSEGGTIRLEAVIELNLLDSGFSSTNSQFELLVLILFFLVEQLEATASYSAMSSSPLNG